MKKKYGFGLLEIIIAMAITAILGTVGLTVYNDQIVRNNQESTKHDMVGLMGDLGKFYTQKGSYATRDGKLPNNIQNEIIAWNKTNKNYKFDVYVRPQTSNMLQSDSSDDYSLNANTQAVCIVAKPLDNTIMSGTGAIIVDDSGTATIGGNQTASALCGSAIPNPFPDPTNDINPKPTQEPPHPPGPQDCGGLPVWSSSVAYPKSPAVKVTWENKIYTNNQYTQGRNPAIGNTSINKGEPWDLVGSCSNSTPTPTPTPTVTPSSSPTPTPTPSPSPTIDPNPFPDGECRDAFDQFDLGKSANQHWATPSDFKGRCKVDNSGTSTATALGKNCNNQASGSWIYLCDGGNCNVPKIYGVGCHNGNCNSALICSTSSEPACKGNCNGNGDIYTAATEPYKLCTGGCQSMTIHYPAKWTEKYPVDIIKNIVCDGKCEVKYYYPK